MRQQVSQLTAQRSELAVLVQTEQDRWNAARPTNEQFQSFSNRLSQLVSLQGLPQLQLQQQPAGVALAEAEQEADDAVWREFELRSIFVMARLQHAFARQQQEELQQQHAQQQLVMQQQLLLLQQQQQQQGVLHPAPPVPEAPAYQGAGLLQQQLLQAAHLGQPEQQNLLQQALLDQWLPQQQQQQMMMGAAGLPGMHLQLQHIPVVMGPPDLHLHLQLQQAYAPLGAAMPPVINLQLHQGLGLPGVHLQPAPVPLGPVWPPGAHLPLQHAPVLMGAADLPGGHLQLPLQVPGGPAIHMYPQHQLHAQQHVQPVLLQQQQGVQQLVQQQAQQAAAQLGLQAHQFAMPQLQ